MDKLDLNNLSDIQLVQLLNAKIMRDLPTYNIDNFTGGHISCTTIYNNTILKYAMYIYFGYTDEEGKLKKKPITKKIDIQESEANIWFNAIQQKVKSKIKNTLGTPDDDLLSLLGSPTPNGSQVEVVVEVEEVGSCSGIPPVVPSDNIQTPITPIEKVPTKEVIIKNWNELIKETNIPALNTISEDRYKKVKTRFKNNGINFFYKIEHAIEKKYPESQFLKDAQWFNFDWIFSNDGNIDKVLSDNYKDKQAKQNKHNQGGHRPSSKPEGF